MTLSSVSRWSFLASLATLPWIGIGVLKLLTGRDLGGGLQPSWVLLAVASMAAYPVLRDPGPGTVPLAWRRLALAAAGALLLSAAGILWAPGVAEGTAAWNRYLKQIVQIIIMAFFLAWPALWVRGAERWRLVARILVLAALGQAAYGLLQYVHWYRPGDLLPVLETVFTSNPSILSGSEQLHIGDSFRDLPRLRGTACEPLYLGNFLLMVIPLVAVTAWSRGVRLACTAALVVLLVLTWSRGAWLAGAAALVTGFVLAPPRTSQQRRRLLGGLALVAGVGGLMALALGPERLGLPLERLAQGLSQRDWSNLTRLYSMQAGWRAFLLSPLVGVGWGQFAWHFPVLVDTAGLQSQFTWPVVNNFPLQILAETGLPGLGVLVAATAGLARATWRARRRALVRSTALACLGVWLQLLFFSQYNLPHIWVAPGLLLAALADGSDNRETLP